MPTRIQKSQVLIGEYGFRLATACLILIVMVLLLSITYDQYDGAILADYFETRDLGGVTVWLKEGQGPFTLALLKVIHFLDGDTQLISWSIFTAFGTAIGLMGVWCTALTLFRSHQAAFWALLLVVLTPIITLTSSSIIGDIYLFYGFSLIGFSLFQQNSLWLNIVGFGLMVLGLENNSSVVLVLGLITFVSFESFLRHRKIPWKNAVIFFGLPIAFYVLYFHVFTASGIYTNYNSFTADKIFALPANLLTSSFTTSYIAPILCLVALTLAPVFCSNIGRRNMLRYGPHLIILLGLSFAVAGPYILARKPPPAYNLFSAIGISDAVFRVENNSNYRHAILTNLCMVFVLVQASAIGWKSTKNNMTRLWGYLALFICALLSLIASISAWTEIYQRDKEVGVFVESLNIERVNSLNVCKLDFSNYKRLSPDKPRPFELAHYAALAGTDRSTAIFDSATLPRIVKNYPKWICASQAHKEKYGVGNLDCSAMLEKEIILSELPDCNTP